MLREQIKRKFDQVNAAIEKLEKEQEQVSKARRAYYLAEVNRNAFFLTRWILKLKAPKVVKPWWQHYWPKTELLALLEVENATVADLAAHFNVYALNAAIRVTQLQGNEELVRQVNEMAVLCKQLNASRPELG
ncbi:hypothetical protein [Hymenobacter translucens]|uniref:hypothetical protein n=1 Tax=Hymenobacter translucens TaxID=2886507 RepID=UPI001D0E1933|nr:hypothetical protein [Hymenobacter translucens]